MFQDCITGKIAYVAAGGATENKDEAKRFSNTREAFYYTRDLTKDGKIDKSIVNAMPL